MTENTKLLEKIVGNPERNIIEYIATKRKRRRIID